MLTSALPGGRKQFAEIISYIEPEGNTRTGRVNSKSRRIFLCAGLIKYCQHAVASKTVMGVSMHLKSAFHSFMDTFNSVKTSGVANIWQTVHNDFYKKLLLVSHIYIALGVGD